MAADRVATSQAFGERVIAITAACLSARETAVAVRMQQNSFRQKFEDYMRSDPFSKDRRRKAYTAVAAKMARVVYAVVTSGIDYRRFPDATRPGGRIPSPGAVEASPTTS